MTFRWGPALSVSFLTGLSFFVFPGHTILQSDTQIYIPILEHIEDRGVLTRDIMAVRPHVAFTLYDEVALLLRRVTGLSFEQVLLGQQFAFRVLGALGVFLIATSSGLGSSVALVVTALVSLGAAVIGPAVLVVEFEPVPRGFSLPFVLLSLGLMAHSRPNLAAGAGAIALAFHPPTALAYVCLLGIVLVRKRQWRPLTLLATGALLLAASASSAKTEPFLARLTPELEAVQRMRASYNWVELWAAKWMRLYVVLWLLSLIAWWRIRMALPRQLHIFVLALPAIGLASVPVSYLLLEHMRLAVAAQFQPARYLLFVTLFAMLLSAIAAARATHKSSFYEAFAFLVLTLSLSAMEWDIANLTVYRMTFVCALAIALSVSLFLFPRSAVAAAFVPFFVLPYAAKVQTYPRLHTPELTALVDWARRSTPTEAMFQFADAGRNLEPGVLRARAVRAIFVDWKSGGQVNFQSDFATEWIGRWMRASKPSPLAGYRELGVDYVVYQAKNKLPDQTPVYENATWIVYASSGRTPAK